VTSVPRSVLGRVKRADGPTNVSANDVPASSLAARPIFGTPHHLAQMVWSKLVAGTERPRRPISRVYPRHRVTRSGCVTVSPVVRHPTRRVEHPGDRQSRRYTCVTVFFWPGLRSPRK